MLLNPYSLITEMVTWSEAHWTPHWMDVLITLLVESLLVVSVYALIVKTERESMYESLLLLLQKNDDGPIFLKGTSTLLYSRELTVYLYHHPDDTIL